MQTDSQTAPLLDPVRAIPARIPTVGYRRREDEYNEEYAGRIVDQYFEQVDSVAETPLFDFVVDLLNELCGEWQG